MYQYAWKF